MDKQQLKQFFNNLADRALEPTDPFYVPLFEGADCDPILEMAESITWSDAATTSLFTGKIGSGKSTELRRLKRELERRDAVVFLSNMRDYMHMESTVEITDFLISLMAALAQEVAEHYQQDPVAKGYGERLWDFLNRELEFGALNLKIGEVAELSLSLKDDPDFKKRLQEHLRGHAARLVQQAKAFAADIALFVREREQDPDRHVVFLVDSVEQLGIGPQAKQVYASVENLFMGHAASLYFPGLHTVYTIPHYLIPLAPNLGARYGGMVYALPAVHILDRVSGKADPHGLAVMHDMVLKRCPDWRQILTGPQLDRISLQTGGDFRDFFRYIRQVLTKLGTALPLRLPADDSLLLQVENQLRREMLPIPQQDLEWLRKIHASKQAELESLEDLPRLARYFDTKLVLNYRNGEDWYDVHPLLHGHLDGS